MRPSFNSIYMNLAKELAKRSTCSRLQVGCVITTTDARKVLALGYNGGAAGLENDCESDQPGQCGHLHAEINAVINCDCPRYVEKIVYCSHLPCKMCAKAIINLGSVKQVWYGQEYRLKDSLDLFARANIACSLME